MGDCTQSQLIGFSFHETRCRPSRFTARIFLYKHSAGDEGIEPSTTVLETVVMPLN